MYDKAEDGTDLDSTTTIFYYISKLFGLFPFQINKSYDKIPFKNSSLGTVYSISLTIIYFSIAIFNNLDENSYSDENLIDEAIFTIYRFYSIIIAVFIMIMSCNNKRRTLEIFDHLHNVAGKLDKQSASMPFSFLKFYHISEIVNLFIHCLVASLLIFVNYTGLPMLIRWIGGTFSSSVVYLMQFQFLNSAHICCRYFKVINAKFDEPTIPNSVKRGSARDLNSVHPTIMKYSTRMTLESDKELKSRIQLYRVAHDTLCDVCEKINANFSLQILTVSAALFSNVTLCLFRLFQMVLTYYNEKDVDATPVLSYTSQHFISLLIWVILIAGLSRTSEEANKTGSLVSSVRLHARSPELDEEIELFLLQLLHRKMKFTAFDFFPLDFTLVYSFVGAVTTYLVILIQFQLMEHSGDVGFNSTSVNLNSTH